MLNDILAVRIWGKVNSAMQKMYLEEMLSATPEDGGCIGIVARNSFGVSFLGRGLRDSDPNGPLYQRWSSNTCAIPRVALENTVGLAGLWLLMGSSDGVSTFSAIQYRVMLHYHSFCHSVARHGQSVTLSFHFQMPRHSWLGAVSILCGNSVFQGQTASICKGLSAHTQDSQVSEPSRSRYQTTCPRL